MPEPKCIARAEYSRSEQRQLSLGGLGLPLLLHTSVVSRKCLYVTPAVSCLTSVELMIDCESGIFD